MFNKKKKSRLYLFSLSLVASGLISTCTFASNSKKSAPVYVEIQGQPVDPSSVPAELRGQIQSPAAYEGDSIPSPRQRDEILKLAGLEDSVQDLDHLSRDLLFYRAQHLSLSELKNRYPKLSSVGLSRLHDLAQKNGARK